ncbi:MAG: SpoIIE family protein phosphatase [Myxococcota bacterium]
MKRHRTRVALLFDNLISEYAVQLRRAVERAASLRDTSVLAIPGEPLGHPDSAAVTQNQIYELIGKDCVDGVIVVSSTMGHYCGVDGLTGLCRGYMPLPVCSVGVELPGIPSLVIDNEGGMRLGVEHLIEAHKCRRIAFIAGPKHSSESNLRLAGYCRALAEHGLPVEPHLLVHGAFTVASGSAKMRELLEGGAAFDAVVCANDNMALGALDVLGEAGLQVPRDVMVCGFDDINSAHFARPSLSTLRQPLWWMGQRAVDSVLRQLEGDSVPLITVGPVEFVRRESCGCGYQVSATVKPTGDKRLSLRDFIRERSEVLARVMRDAVALPSDALGNWPGELLNALDRELAGEDGRFSTTLENVLERAQHEGASLDEFQRVVSVLRAEFRSVEVANRHETRLVERLWHNARVLVGAASIRLLGRQQIEQQQATSWLGWVGERLATTLSLPLLKEELVKSLPYLEISRASVALYTGRRSGELKSLMARVESGELLLHNEPFRETLLAPEAVFDTKRSEHFVVLPITFESEMLGVAVLAGGAQSGVYESLRQQIGSAVKGAMLHREMVAQVTLRERLEAERVAEEARLAAAIQTSMIPVIMDVPELELSGLMVPAAEAGGDYYDVIPTPQGAWIGIGDVTGHGLGSGLIMVMIQSMIAGLCRLTPSPSPSQVISALGEAVWDNVRERLKRDDHATLTVFRYQRGGHFTFAGAHEDLIVYRAATGRCETIQTPGFWVGAMPSVRRLTQDSELILNADDVLVLYTDGITEARNVHQEQFSLERLVKCVEATATKSSAAIRDAINEEVTAWRASVDDDMTLLVIKYVPTAAHV